MHVDYLEHHGILGQKWGVRRYQNPDGTLTVAGRYRVRKLDKAIAKSKKQREKYATEENDFKRAFRYGRMGKADIDLRDLIHEYGGFKKVSELKAEYGDNYAKEVIKAKKFWAERLVNY